VQNLGRYLGKYLSKQKHDIGLNEKAVIKLLGFILSILSVCGC